MGDRNNPPPNGSCWEFRWEFTVLWEFLRFFGSLWELLWEFFKHRLACAIVLQIVLSMHRSALIGPGVERF